MEEKNLLEIQDLVIRFHTDDGVIEAVNGISLSLKAGETLDDVARNFAVLKQEILALNGISDEASVSAGAKLKIPMSSQ